MQQQTLTNINILLPNFWNYVSPVHLQQENIQFEQLEILNKQIEILDMRSKSDFKMLEQQNKRIYSLIKRIYDQHKTQNNKIKHKIQTGFVDLDRNQPSCDIRLYSGVSGPPLSSLFQNVLKKKVEEKSVEDQQDQIDKVKREILFNLNRVVPENVKDIFKQIEDYATSDYILCVILVDSIIQKSWQQPKYAASYAKLSSYCAKIDINQFCFDNQKKEKRNPFQRILMDNVQHSFDKRQMKDAPKQPEDLEKFAREYKNLLVGNVKFIAELIKIRLIPKIIIKYCISELVSNFLQGYYDFFVNKNTQLNFYEYNFEVLIEFLDTLGEKYESIEEKQKYKEDKQQDSSKILNYKEVEQKLKQICKLQKPFSIIENYENLRANEYFASLALISQFALPKVKDGRRIIALFQNLQQRRFNNWKKLNVESEGPKKLKDLKNQEQQMTPEQKAKAQQALLDDKMSELLKKLVNNEKKAAHQQLFSLIKKYKIEQIIGSYLKFVSDDIKQHIAGRMEIFDIIMQKYGGKKVFKSAWKSNFSKISFLASQFPYCAAVLGKFLTQYKQKYGGQITDFFIKYNEDDQEDEYFLMDSVLQKAYHYSKDEKITKFITPYKKVTHLLE